MAGAKQVLKPKQFEAIEILTVEDIDNTALGTRLGVTEKTIRNWKKNPAFMDALQNSIKDSCI